ncbi:hypothetical protein [Fodinibacter luteus]
MISVVLGLLLCVGLALTVMALVAVPARREGRDVLSERGEEVIGSIRERQLPGRRDDAAAGRRPVPEGSGPLDAAVATHR